ncbi:hypothetical protein UL82_03015 [Corynebacterium kutscheri]|uniref:Uncharacterized protein n=2 Tax=Corynebacterium kutscheri TaxID=35755 RepID=A0A0F6R149_9CORY|nr:hypothetical protein UL82_03015 [Corynebacterium kutscheri]VEH06518.1 Uncharacterised protein [Corynebacterium kutscheri]VEH09115.1 Uncharacterised protein [Corynebacterium kutscheri]
MHTLIESLVMTTAFIRLIQSELVLPDIRAFEEYRHALSTLDDAKKPDKRTTKFVNTADLAWAWIVDSSEHGLRAVANKINKDKELGLNPEEISESLSELIAQWEYADPSYTALIDADGGLRFRS